MSSLLSPSPRALIKKKEEWPLGGSIPSSCQHPNLLVALVVGVLHPQQLQLQQQQGQGQGQSIGKPLKKYIQTNVRRCARRPTKPCWRFWIKKRDILTPL